jgi:hypothetical protein
LSEEGQYSLSQPASDLSRFRFFQHGDCVYAVDEIITISYKDLSLDALNKLNNPKSKRMGLLTVLGNLVATHPIKEEVGIPSVVSATFVNAAEVFASHFTPITPGIFKSAPLEKLEAC